MIRAQRVIPAAPADVYAVLANGWEYSRWVVGTQAVLHVDPGWPEPGSRLHHRFGVRPIHLEDTTSVVETEPGRSLVLRPRAGALGAARVELRLEPDGSGTRVSMEEVVIRPRLLRWLALGPVTWWRNSASLRRLEDVVADHRGATPVHPPRSRLVGRLRDRV